VPPPPAGLSEILQGGCYMGHCRSTFSWKTNLSVKIRVVKIKRNSDRPIERYKARLVLLVHLQQKDVDFFENYSHVVDFTAVRIALAIACQMEMSTHHLDVKCVFLYGTIDEEIYMRLPEEYAHSDGKVCRLKNSIYGLKKAPRAWNC
jgi:hypothetical protein